MNAVNTIGNLTRDIELTYTPGGFAIGKISIAVNDRKKSGEQWTDVAHFFDVTLLGATATGLAPYLLKGKKIGVSGKLQQDRWQDKQSGANRSKVYILASNITLLGSKDENQATGAPQGGQAPTSNGPGPQGPPPAQGAGNVANAQAVFGDPNGPAPMVTPGPPQGNTAGFQDDYPDQPPY